MPHSTNYMMGASDREQTDLGLYTLKGVTRLIDEAKAKLDEYREAFAWMEQGDEIHIFSNGDDRGFAVPNGFTVQWAIEHGWDGDYECKDCEAPTLLEAVEKAREETDGE